MKIYKYLLWVACCVIILCSSIKIYLSSYGEEILREEAVKFVAYQSVLVWNIHPKYLDIPQVTQEYNCYTSTISCDNIPFLYVDTVFNEYKGIIYLGTSTEPIENGVKALEQSQIDYRRKKGKVDYRQIVSP